MNLFYNKINKLFNENHKLYFIQKIYPMNLIINKYITNDFVFIFIFILHMWKKKCRKKKKNNKTPMEMSCLHVFHIHHVVFKHKKKMNNGGVSRTNEGNMVDDPKWGYCAASLTLLNSHILLLLSYNNICTPHIYIYLHVHMRWVKRLKRIILIVIAIIIVVVKGVPMKTSHFVIRKPFRRPLPVFTRAQNTVSNFVGLTTLVRAFARANKPPAHWRVDNREREGCRFCEWGMRARAKSEGGNQIRLKEKKKEKKKTFE